MEQIHKAFSASFTAERELCRLGGIMTGDAERFVPMEGLRLTAKAIADAGKLKDAVSEVWRLVKEGA